MGEYSLKLPDLGEGVVESEILAWRVKPGDQVVEDQAIADVMTDKATVEIGSPVDGVVLSLGCNAGDSLAVGKELVRFTVRGAGNIEQEINQEPGQAPDQEMAQSTIGEALNENNIPTLQTPVATASEPEIKFHQDRIEPTPHAKQTPSHSDANDEHSSTAPLYPQRLILTSPSVRRRAREAAVDLSMVPGSGPEGRIESSDLEIFISHSNGSSNGGATLQRKIGQLSQKISGLRRVIANNIAAAKRDIPHYSYIDEADLTELEGLRQQLNSERTPHQTKLTILPFIVRALVNVLPQHSHCNAHYHAPSEELTVFNPVHVGIATMTEQGLTVPVVRHAEALDPWQCAAEIARLAEAVRAHRARPEELSGSTITITSLGTLGGLATTPVINAPETSIIGVNKLQQRPVVIDGELKIRTMMNLSASFDHRIVDGYHGAQLVQAVIKQLQNPALLFM